MSPFPPKWAAVAILSVLCWGLGGWREKAAEEQSHVFPSCWKALLSNRQFSQMFTR